MPARNNPYWHLPVSYTHLDVYKRQLYLLAAMLSLAVVVVPSGLVVREALFVWLGTASGFPPALLLFVAVVTRLAMTIGEALNAAFFSFADYLQRRRLHTTIAD